MQHQSLADQLRPLIESGHLPPPLPDFAHSLSTADWCRALKTLAGEVRADRRSERLFPITNRKRVQDAVRIARELSRTGAVPPLDRFFALVCLLRQRRDEAHYLCIELAEAAFDTEPHLIGALEQDVLLFARCSDEVRCRAGGDKFDKRLTGLRIQVEEERRREVARREAEWRHAEMLRREAEERRRQAARRATLTRLQDLDLRYRAAKVDFNVPAGGFRVDPIDMRLAIEWSPPEAYEWLVALLREAGGDWDEFRLRCQEVERQEFERREAKGQRAESPESSALSHLNRNLSARQAERAVEWFIRYRMPSYTATDVSGEQGRELLRTLPPPRKPPRRYTEADWETHDLRVSSRRGKTIRLDVKNARTTYLEGDWREVQSRPERWSYREHYVPQCKKDRSGLDIHIAGVLSPGRQTSQLLLSRHPEPVRFLGTVSRTTIEDLQTTFCLPGVLELRLDAAGRLSKEGYDSIFVPPWMFSLPAPLYAAARRVRNAARREFARHAGLLSAPDPSLLPLYIAAGAHDVLPSWAESLPQPWDRFVRDLSQKARKPGLSLPVIYLSILRHFLETICSGCTAGFTPGRYREFLVAKGSSKMPLGIHDPVDSVESLIGSLSLLMEANLEQLGQFTSFRFSRTGMLSAREPGSGKWKTLLFPYCGGGACKRLNLALGKDNVQNCPDCGHLKCSDVNCRFCSHNCSKNRNRQNAEDPESHLRVTDPPPS